ncbi:hypothetical protein LR48_Vigan04g032300 [Vigna angularis]|uniref:FCP1 homology domain-containing protein n=1 Tax=Phaseolus angularis TaxID=3914 RepID=A0A0L9UB26_PHAAN|nr:hypothetical protein LR48_Vigan04g032300 [Vigna angularis]
MDVVNDFHMGGSTSTEDVNLSQKRKTPKRKKQEFNSTKQNEKSKRKKTTHNPIEGNNSGCGTSENTFSPKASVPALDMQSGHPIQCFSTDPITSQSCEEVGFRQGGHEEKEQKMINATAEKASSPALDMLSGHPIQCLSTDPITSQSCEEMDFYQGDQEEKEQKMISTTAAKASIPAYDMLSGNPIQCFSTDTITSQSCEEVAFCLGDHEEKEQKMSKTTAAKASTPALDMLSGHPIQCFSTDPITGQSCEEVGFCLGDREQKEKKMINTTAAKASSPALDLLSGRPIQRFSTDPITCESCEEVGFCQGDHEEKEQKTMDTTAEKQHNVSEVSCNHTSVAASPEPFSKESVPEVVKLSTEHSINDNISNPEDKNSFVNDTSMMKEDVDDPAHYELSDINMCYKACTRRQMVDADCRRSSGDHSPESANKEPTFQDHDKDHSHQFSDGSLRVGLMDGETKLSFDQVTSHSGAAAEEIKLSTDIIDEQRFITTSVVDIPVEHLEADGRQQDDTEITRSNLCCAGEQIELNTDNIDEERSMPASSAVGIHAEQVETNGRQLDHAEITRNDMCCAGDVSDLSLDTVRDGHLKISQFSLDRSGLGNPKKKLLILDVNGLLADFVSIHDTRTRYRREREPDFILKGRKVYKRPFFENFLQFCLDRFHVGVWSSRAKCNVDEAIKFLMGKSASKLLFCWNQSHCTTTEFTTVEDLHKPLVLKELRKLWEKEEADLPWEKGEFNESNTLLLDDSPYKALMNPMHSAIFPYSYRYFYTRDSELGPEGDLRIYLEGLALAENVRKYVSENPFGQRPIREANPSWGYYRRVIESVQKKRSGTAFV